MINKNLITSKTNYFYEINKFVENKIIEKNFKNNIIEFWNENQYSFHDVHFFCYIIRELTRNELFEDNSQYYDDPFAIKAKKFLLSNFKSDYKVQINNFVSQNKYGKNEKMYFVYTFCDSILLYCTFAKLRYFADINIKKQQN